MFDGDMDSSHITNNHHLVLGFMWAQQVERALWVRKWPVTVVDKALLSILLSLSLLILVLLCGCYRNVTYIHTIMPVCDRSFANKHNDITTNCRSRTVAGTVIFTSLHALIFIHVNQWTPGGLTTERRSDTGRLATNLCHHGGRERITMRSSHITAHIFTNNCDYSLFIIGETQWQIVGAFLKCN